MIFLFFSHGILKLKDSDESVGHIVWKDSAHSMSIAYVHVAIIKSRCNDHILSIDHSICRYRGQIPSFSNLRNSLALDHDRSITNNSALGVEGQNISSVL